MSSSKSSNGQVITTYDDDKRRQAVRSKRRTTRIIGKFFVCICSISTCATIVFLALYMRREIFTFRDWAAKPMDNTQSIDEAQFGYFGPQLENFWRAILIANLGLAFLASLYIPLGVIFEHYYPITVYGGLMFLEAVLSIGNQYMAVSYYFASAIFFTTGLSVHIFVHFLRLDIVDEIVEWKRHEAEELLKRRNEEMIDDSHERSSSFELGPVRPKSSMAY